MGWETRHKKRYYYRSARTNGQPRKLYLGGGAAGEAHARQDASDRRRRALGRLALGAESYRRRVARLKADLNGPHPTPTEALLVEQVVSCWLATKYDEMSAALHGGSAQQAALGLRRVESTQRRYAAALKLLALLRARLPQGLAPVNTLALYEGKRERA